MFFLRNLHISKAKLGSQLWLRQTIWNKHYIFYFHKLMSNHLKILRFDFDLKRKYIFIDINLTQK